MVSENQIAIAGIGVVSAFSKDMAAFSRVIYHNNQPAIDGLFVCTPSDVNHASVEALKDAGVPTDVNISLLMCGDVPYQSLANFLHDSGYTLLGMEQADAFISGIRQAVSSLTTRHNSVILIVAKDDAGVGALVLTQKRDLISGECYAVLDSHCHYELNRVKTLCQDALAQAGIEPGEVGYFETTVSDLPDWVLDAYRETGFDLTCAWGSLAGNIPLSGTAQTQPSLSICSFIRVLISLYRRTLPAFPGWEMTGDRRRWQHTPFYTIQQARSWFVEPGKLKRYAAWLEVTDAYAGHIILSEPGTVRPVSLVNSRLGEKTVWLLPVTGHNQQELHQNLIDLQNRINAEEPIDSIFRIQIIRYEENRDAAYALVILGRNREEIVSEISLALKGIDRAYTSGKTYRTPRGSVFTPTPQSEGDIVFVYPGAFNSYVGFGRELLQHFPFLHEKLAILITNVGRSLAERRLYPRNLERLSAAEEESWTLRLSRNPIAMIESGTTFAIAYSMIMQEVFNIHPQSAMGYSLGEISMLWSAGVWNTGDAGSAAWHASPLFKTRLFGPKQAVREAWDIQPENDEFWSTYVLKAQEDRVKTLVAEEPRVYLTIVNLPEEVVIAGETAGCQRIIDSLGCHAIKTPFDSVIHNEVVRSEYDTFVKLYTHPINHKPDIVFYSAAEYAPLILDADNLAQSIAKMTCKPLHLPRLVETVYEGGGRIFIEIGPQATCSRWIDRILLDKPHVALSINRTGMGDFHGILSVFAQLMTNRRHINLQPLLLGLKTQGKRRISLPIDEQPEPVSIAGVSSAVTHKRIPLIVGEKRRERQTVSTPVNKPLSMIDRTIHQSLLPQQLKLAQNHMAFLQVRRDALRDTGALIAMQIAVAEKMFTTHDTSPLRDSADIPERKSHSQNRVSLSKTGFVAEPVLFSKMQLEEFANGNVEKCFGEDYAIYRGRRLPRIPNSDLLLIDRIIDIQGTRGIFDNEPILLSQYDVPANAWYFHDSEYTKLPPYGILMEIALQPCGFLAAYLGSTLATPRMDYYFRNLDGKGLLVRENPIKGKTINNKVKLVSSISLRGIIMQRYEFELSCENDVFYTGEASFGYFTNDALSDQVGLDKGHTISPDYENTTKSWESLPVPRKDQMHTLDKCVYVAQGGQFGNGTIYGEANITSDAWFFTCHFYQDPVMPGSLGVDLMYQSLELTLRQLLDNNDQISFTPHNHHISYEAGHELSWTYRGQVTPSNKKITVELHIKTLSLTDRWVKATADGSLWVDGLRIYGVSNLSLQLTPT